MKKAFSTRLFTFGLVAGAFALVAFSVHAVYAPEISGWYLETTYSDAAVAAGASCPSGERCVEWCDVTGNGSIVPSGSLCCVPLWQVGQEAFNTTCRRPAG